jgi:hypothetical protein
MNMVDLDYFTYFFTIFIVSTFWKGFERQHVVLAVVPSRRPAFVDLGKSCDYVM